MIYPGFAVRQVRHLRTRRVKTRGKLGFQDGGQLPPDLDNLDLTRGILNLGNFNTRDSIDTRDDRICLCIAMHGKFGYFMAFPNFCLWTDPLPVLTRDAD